MRFELRQSLRASDDIDSATEWLVGNRSARFATDWLDLLHAAFEQLQFDPTRYPPAYEAADIGRDLREMHFGRRPSVYRIIFEVRGTVVHVLRVRHSAQDDLTEDDLARQLSE